MKHFYFVVEGAHDLAVIGKTLKLLGFQEIRRKRDLSPMWCSRMIPGKYPFHEDFLERITPQPSFLQNDDISIAIHVANGLADIVKTIELNIGNMSLKELHQLNGIVIFVMPIKIQQQ